MAKRFGALSWICLLLGGTSLFLAAAVLVWWGPIREWFMDPGVPYQTYSPPPAPDYGQGSAWALLPVGEAPRGADVFFVHPTTYDGDEWNADIDDARARRLLNEVMIPNHAGPFLKVGRVFAPRYRQANLYSTLTLREDARDARAFAYGDIRTAFDRYIDTYDEGLPLVIVGVEQGGVLAERLARELAADPAMKGRIAAVYLIETAVPADAYGEGAVLPACRARGQTGCVAAWVGETYNDASRTPYRLRHAPVWNGGQLVSLAGREPLCFNPLLGAVTGQTAEAKSHLGGANASGLEWGARPGFQQHQIGAQCVDGVLKITRPRAPALRPALSWTERQEARPYSLFYADLEADALARVAALAKPAAAP